MSIKRFFIYVISLSCITLFYSCNKKEDECKKPDIFVPTREHEVLDMHIARNQIDAIKAPEGFYYAIHAQGEGKTPDYCSRIKVNYQGNLATNEKFDENTNTEFSLGNLVSGWALGLQHIQEKGIITLYLPPSMGYGNQIVNNIPPNSILIFKIELLEVLD